MSIDDEIRTAATVAARSVTPDADRDLSAAVARGQRRQRRRRAAGGVVAAGLLVVAGGVGWAVVAGDDGPGRGDDQAISADIAGEDDDVEEPTATTTEVEDAGDENGGWRATSPAPIDGRDHGPAIAWTGSEVVVWGGSTLATTPLAAAYDPGADSWRTVPTDQPPITGPASVWTGAELIVWGGQPSCPDPLGCDLPTAPLRFDPATGTITEGAAAPITGRIEAMTIWTGNRMIVWGGFSPTAENGEADGALYDPATDTWEPIPANPFGQRGTAVVAFHDGSLVVGAGESFTDGDAGWYRYDLAAGEWSALPEPPVRFDPLASGVQVGDELVVWNGTTPDGSGGGGGGAVLDLATLEWRPTAEGPVGRPMATEGAAVDGRAVFLVPDDGLLATYDPAADVWTSGPIPTEVGPSDGGSAARTVVAIGSGDVLVWNEVTGIGAVGNVAAVTAGPGTGTTESGEPLAGPAMDAVVVPALDDGRPAAWLGVTTTGRVVEVDTAGESVTRDRGGLADPTIDAPNAEAPPNFVEAAWALPGTGTVLVSECCEPAAGSVLPVEDVVTEDRSAGWSGYAAVPSPDGRFVAIPSQSGLFVATTGLEPTDADPVSATANFGAPAAAWLRDRRGLVWAPYADEGQIIEVVELTADNRQAAVRQLPTPELSGMSVAVRGDGAIVVAGCTGRDVTDPEQVCERSRAVVLDPDTGEVTAEFAIEPGARLGGYDPSGTYLIYVDDAGIARWQGAGRSGVLGEGYRWATW